MRASGLELRFEQRKRRIEIRPRLDATEHGARDATLAIDPHAPLAITRDRGLERKLHPAHRVAPFTAHQDEVALVDASLAELRMESGERSAFFRNQQHAGGVAVEPVDELEEPGVRAG